MTARRRLTFLGILPIAWTAFATSAKSAEWPVPGDLRVGEVFKYPILGVPGHEVRPTQAAVGFLAVEEKRKELEKLSHKELKKTLKQRPIPVVSAPDGRFYMIDHHHQSVAARQVGRENAFFVLYADYSKRSGMDEFWRVMKGNHWVREFDRLGRPIPIPKGLPKSILGLLDDPYRSLSWFVRRSGGYRKTDVEFAEFAWADFFRTRIPLGRTKKDFKRAVDRAISIAHSDEAKGLPGWSRHRVLDVEGFGCRTILSPIGGF